VRVVRERDDDAIDSERVRDLGKAIRRAEDPGHRAPVLSRWIRVDEAEEVETVLRMARELQGDVTTHLAGADDNCVLDVGDAPPASGTGEHAAEHDEDRPREPERQEARDRGIRHSSHEIVDRRVVGPCLVAPVETVEVGADDPDRHCREEEKDLVSVRQPIGRARDSAVELERKEEGGHGTDDVGDHERTTHEPAPPTRSQPARPALLEEGHASRIEPVLEWQDRFDGALYRRHGALWALCPKCSPLFSPQAHTGPSPQPHTLLRNPSELNVSRRASGRPCACTRKAGRSAPAAPVTPVEAERKGPGLLSPALPLHAARPVDPAGRGPTASGASTPW
jgi:hypothetical protein